MRREEHFNILDQFIITNIVLQVLLEGGVTREISQFMKPKYSDNMKVVFFFQPFCFFLKISEINFCSFVFLSLSTVFIFNSILQ